MARRTDRRGEPTDEYLEELDAWWDRVKDSVPPADQIRPDIVKDAQLPNPAPEPTNPF